MTAYIFLGVVLILGVLWLASELELRLLRRKARLK